MDGQSTIAYRCGVLPDARGSGEDDTHSRWPPAAPQALGHSDLSTTLGIYGHQDQRDLERAMEALARMREAGSIDDEP